MTREEALAYFTPHVLTKGPVMLDPEKMRAGVGALRESIAEAARFKTRLELDHCYDLAGNPVPWPEGMTPIDGIACRDETIKGQDEQIEGLARERNAYRDVAKLFIAVAAENDPTKRAQLLDKAERGARTLLSQSSEGE